MKKVIILLILIFVIGCFKKEAEEINRYLLIPEDAIKITEEMDLNPPKSFSSEYYDPIPLPYPINTAGGEDSAFIMADGKTLYFWFTPDVRKEPEEQVKDGVTGIYVSKMIDNNWQEPERLYLQEKNKLALDGCAFVSATEIWFCSAREGYDNINWFKAKIDNGVINWQKIDFPPEYEIGELHIFQDIIYFHSAKEGTKGKLDIWQMKIDEDGFYEEPINIEVINSEDDEGFPAISPDGKELWFSKNYGIWRSKKVDDEWTKPVLMFYPLAGEPSIDAKGNVYFTHHFFQEDKMVESDIYVAYKK